MSELREYKINGTIIIGIDHGYGNIKTARRVFPTSVIKSDEAPAISSEYIEYNGSFYIIGEGHKTFVEEKQMDEDNYVLTLVAIAKELNARGISKAKIHLAVGLPLKWVQAQRKSFTEYLLREKNLRYVYKGITYEVEIAGCTVMPQCYAAVAENLKDFTGMNMLADVGNGTMNIMILNNGRAMESKAWTEKMGIHQCFMKIQNEVMDKTGVKLPDEVINNYLRYGETDVDEKYASIMKKAAEKYVAELFNCLKDHEYNSGLMKLHFMGGGAKIVEAVGDFDKDRISFIHDICATAKGYEYFCYMKLKAENINRVM